MRLSAPIRFEFDEKKAVSAAAILLKKSAGRMPFIRLMKLLYIADRESLRRRGRPIVGDNYLSMKRGPVMETVYSLIKAASDDLGEEDVWRRHVRTVGYDVQLAADPGMDALSESEIEILGEVFDSYRDCDRWELCDVTHEFPEWRNPGESCRPIHPEDILRALGLPDEEVRRIAKETLERQRANAFFRNEVAT